MPAAALLAGACRSPEQRAQLDDARADQFLAAGNLPAAAGMLARASGEDGNNVELWLKLGHVQLQMNAFQAAQNAFQHAADLAPDSVDALENLTVLAARGQALDDAKRYMGPLLLLQPDDPAGLLAKGAIALRERRPAEALAVAAQLLATSPGMTESYIMRARALVAVGKRREAIALLERRAITDASAPNLSQILSLLLEQYQAVGDVAGIRSTALRLHAIDPADPRYTMEIARLLHAGGHDDAAAALLEKLQQQFPRTPAVIGAIADHWRATLPPPAAAAAMLRMASGAPLVAQVTIANHLIDAGAPASALALLGPRVSGPITGTTVDSATAYARALAAAGRAGAAAELIDRVLSFDPGDMAALIVQARLLMAQRKWAAAMAAAQRAVSGDATSREAALLLAQVYAAAGSPVLAQQAYAQAVQAFPNDFTVLRDYTDWLLATGRAGETLFQLAAFARDHQSYAPAWRQYARACGAANNPCIAEARAGAAKLG